MAAQSCDPKQADCSLLALVSQPRGGLTRGSTRLTTASLLSVKLIARRLSPALGSFHLFRPNNMFVTRIWPAFLF